MPFVVRGFAVSARRWFHRGARVPRENIPEPLFSRGQPAGVQHREEPLLRQRQAATQTQQREVRGRPEPNALVPEVLRSGLPAVSVGGRKVAGRDLFRVRLRRSRDGRPVGQPAGGDRGHRAVDFRLISNSNNVHICTWAGFVRQEINCTDNFRKIILLYLYTTNT